ncbi:MAG: (Fe-S)-binding protein [Desulfobacteraceae bacterium]|nr:(Fe-S)-binding protein [Desulfobacteraceae bacterium]
MKEDATEDIKTENKPGKKETVKRPAREKKKSKKTAESVDILYYVGCTASYDVNVKEVGINTVNILDALGLKFGILGNEEKCCGSVLLRVGDHEFERLAADNIRAFNSLNVKMLVTSCSGCFKTIREDYKRVGELNMDVLHTAELMARLIREKKIELKNEVPLKVTYHDPCHLGRHSGVFNAPREVLSAIPGIEFVEMDRIREFSRCCGAGGGLKAGFPDLQNQMATERVRDAEKTGAIRLVSCCPFCYQGLQIGVSAIKSNVKMTDITELVAISMGIKEVKG